MIQIRRALILCLMILSFSVAPASAHTRLVSTVPEAGSTLKELPNSISLTFADNLSNFSEKANSVIVEDASGENISLGKARVDGETLNLELKPVENEFQVFKVSYRTISEDGHALTGTYNFEVTKDGVVSPGFKAVTNSKIEPDSNSSGISHLLSHHRSHIILSGVALLTILGWSLYRARTM